MRDPWEKKYPAFVCCEQLRDREQHVFYPGEPMKCFIRVECEPYTGNLFQLRVTAGLEVDGVGSAGHVKLAPEQLLTKDEIIGFVSAVTWDSIKAGVRQNLLDGIRKEKAQGLPEVDPGQQFTSIVECAAREINDQL